MQSVPKGWPEVGAQYFGVWPKLGVLTLFGRGGILGQHSIDSGIREVGAAAKGRELRGKHSDLKGQLIRGQWDRRTHSLVH